MTSGRRETTEAALQRLRQHFVDNLSASTAALDELADRIGAGPGVAESLVELGRELHRLRGTAGTFGFGAAAALAQDLEAEVAGWRTGDAQAEGDMRSARVRRFIDDFNSACGATSPPRARSRDHDAR